MKMPRHNLPKTTLRAGDRVIAEDGAGIRYSGHLHHENGGGQFYVMPDAARQPFYAFPNEIRSLNAKQPGFAEKAVLTEIDRQHAYVNHMRDRNL